MPLSKLLYAGQVGALTSFFSLAYLAFFLTSCILLYSIVSNRAKPYLLLIVSYIFYWLISGKLILYLILSTFSIHYFGLWLDKIQTKMKEQLATAEKESKKDIKKRYNISQRNIVFLAAIFHIGMLLTFKYSAFFTTNINSLLLFLGSSVQLEIPSYVMPIGISFFTLQAMSYILDVYHGVTKADENLFRLALFLSFFPQIVEGPICRYNQTSEKLWNLKPIRYENLTLGYQRILYGMLKKVVIADRLNPLVEVVFKHYNIYSGATIAIAAACYTIQLYMDFSGSMDAVIGTAQIFGIELPENFKRPFFSRTISEFWNRWHITLGAWFRDYIFYPVTTSASMKKLTQNARKKLGNHYGPLVAGGISLFCVWFCNGLWHGSAWNFILFGMYHFILILGGSLINPPVKKINASLNIDSESFLYRLMQMIRTTILVIIGELIFRAYGLLAALKMLAIMITNFSPGSVKDEIFYSTGIDPYDFIVVGITLIAVFIISLMSEKGIDVRASLAKKNIILRWSLLYALIIFIVIFGAYGPGYAAIEPLYAQF